MTGASITIMDGAQGQEPVCATNAGAARIDELQFSLGDGPCVESFTTARVVLVTDIADPNERRWPLFAAAAADTGARGMFVFPLHVGAAKIGVLDCYRDTPGPLTDDDLSGALRAADAAVWTLLDRLEARSIGDGDDPPLDVDTLLDRSALVRAEVHQATGMIIAQAGIDPPTALARLRAVAFSAGRPISEMADGVLARRLRLGRDGAWHTTGEHRTGEHDPSDPIEPTSQDRESP